MPLPRFDERPDEKSNLEPEIVRLLSEHALDVIVLDGRIDLLIRSKNCFPDHFLELKVCLNGSWKSPPISSEQWSFLKSISLDSPFDSRYRVLIYNHSIKSYAFVSGPQNSTGPTSYRSFVNVLYFKNMFKGASLVIA